ncbi:MAG TPA: flagellar brake protein [Chloroflexota bacterium]|nr:flagellar brake protein [Chloroflexota bacterium]
MVSAGISGLRIGQTCEITIEAAEGGGQYKSRIEDVEGESIKVAMPTHRGELVVPAMGRVMQIAVQGSGGGTIFIQAEVTGRQSQPFPVLTVRALSASQQQARSYFRADVTVWPTECSVWGESPVDHGAGNTPGHEGQPAHAAEGHAGQAAHPTPAAHGTHAANGAGSHDGHAVPAHHAFWRPVHASLHDLSGGGAALLVHEHLREGDRVKLRFPLPHGGGEVTTTGEVRRSISRGRDAQGEVRWDVGIAFENVKAELRDRLVKAVNRIQAEDRRRQQAG